MLRVIFSMLVAITLLILIPPDAFAEAYWGNLKVDIERSVRISGPNSDIIMIEAEFTNNDDEQISIYYDYVRLDDSKNREFSHSVYWTLEDKGHDVTERECPFDWYIDLNPGISEDARFCFEVPKENLTFIFHIYESYLDWCKNPSYGSCQEKTIRLSIRAPDPTPPTSPSSSPSSGSDVETTQIQSRGDIAIAYGSGAPGCEETRSCYIPYRLDVGVGSTVTWHNVDSVVHTVTSGTPSKGPSGVFDSSLMMSDTFYSLEFTRDGVFNYYCVVHPWMTGQINVQRSGTIIGEPASAIPKDTIPPKMLKPADIETDAENQNGAKATFEVLAIDDTDQTIRPVCNPSSGSLFSIGETIVTCNAMDSAGNRALPISFTVTVNPLETTIPSWVKNIAAFWCADRIDDDSFIEGIKYLIDNNIIFVSSTLSGNTDSQGIPEWVKNNACWWAENLISDKDFASGIQFLVQAGIIVVGQSEQIPSNIISSNESSEYFTEEEIVSQMLDVSIISRYTSLEDRSVKIEDGTTRVSYSLYNDNNEAVGSVVMSKDGSGIVSLAIATPYDIDIESIQDALWILNSAVSTLVPIEDWENEEDTTFLVWLTETIQEGVDNKNIVINDKRVVYSNNKDNFPDFGIFVIGIIY